jgi:hypothetical protein
MDGMVYPSVRLKLNGKTEVCYILKKQRGLGNLEFYFLLILLYETKI